MTLSSNGKRTGAWILLLIALFFQANYHLGWGVLARFDKQAMIASLLVVAVYVLRVGPSLEELKADRDRRNRVKRHPTRFRGGLYILVFSLAMLLVTVLWPVLRTAKGNPIQSEDWIALILLDAVMLAVGVRGWYVLKRLYEGKEER